MDGRCDSLRKLYEQPIHDRMFRIFITTDLRYYQGRRKDLVFGRAIQFKQ